MAVNSARADSHEELPGIAGAPYPDMPGIPPTGVRIGKHLGVPESAKGPAIDPAKGYRLQELGEGLYMITDNCYQSMFMVYETGVVVIDAPTSYAQHIPKAIAEVTNKPITHIVYSHAAIDHIGGSKSLGGQPIIIAQDETERLLVRAKIPIVLYRRSRSATNTRSKSGVKYWNFPIMEMLMSLGNIFIFAPAQRTLMVVDVIFPGWMPWRAFALAQDIPGYFAQVEEIKQMKWDTLVSGHVERTGTHADVEVQLEFMNDLRDAAREALKTTKPGEGLDICDKANPWAYYGNYIDRVAIQCVNKVTPKWSTKLAGYDVFIWDQCYAIVESLRLDEQ